MRLEVCLLFVGLAAALRQQSVAVKGRLRCGKAPAIAVRVKLFDVDRGLGRDDLLQQGYTDDEGVFELRGDTKETTSIDPVLRILHDCDDGLKPGQRKTTLKIPKHYVTEGNKANKVFDIGDFNLEVDVQGEERVVDKNR